MEDKRYTVSVNFDLGETSTWFEPHKRKDGNYDLIGMARYVEYDSLGRVIRDETVTTGLNGWAPMSEIEPEPVQSGVHAFMEVVKALEAIPHKEPFDRSAMMKAWHAKQKAQKDPSGQK